MSCGHRDTPMASSASASRSRRRAPTTGTISAPCAATQAIAACATLMPLAPATLRSASTRARFASTLSPWNRGLKARKSRPDAAPFCQWPLMRPPHRSMPTTARCADPLEVTAEIALLGGPLLERPREQKRVGAAAGEVGGVDTLAAGVERAKTPGNPLLPIRRAGHARHAHTAE